MAQRAGAKRYTTESIRINEVQQGFELAIPSGDDQPPRRFVVDDITFTHNKAAGERPRFILPPPGLLRIGQLRSTPGSMIR
jgi:hypothetical protein